jgi:hypothetical protein
MNRRSRHPGKSATAAKAPVPEARIALKVQPGASADRLLGKSGETWKLAVTAPPVDGRANRACIEFLAGLLRVPRSSIRIVRGDTSRQKLVAIQGVSQQDAEDALNRKVESNT